MPAILAFARTDFTILGSEECCCGYPLLAAGQRERARELMQHNVEQIQARGAHTLVATCPSCFHMWHHEYPAMFGVPLPFEVKHSTQLIAQMIDHRAFELTAFDGTITYHDPCDLGRKSHVFDAPRAVLDAIPSARFVEMTNYGTNAMCCGGGGNLETFDPTLPPMIASERLDDAVSTGANVLVRVDPLPEERHFQSFLFEDLDRGIEAGRRIMAQRLNPCVIRLYDEVDTKKYVKRVVNLDVTGSYMVIGVDGLRELNDVIWKKIFNICKELGGQDLGSDAGQKWWDHRHDFYFPPFAKALPKLYGTFETVTTFKNIKPLYYATKEFIEKQYANHGASFFAHFSHWYPWGVMVYASGMATGGRVLHHMKAALPDGRFTVLFVGYQAEGTRGRDLVDGAREVKIHGQFVPVNARIAKIDSMSAHADRNETLRWLKGFGEAPKTTYLVHGEPAAQASLKARIEKDLGWRVEVPEYRQAVNL